MGDGSRGSRRQGGRNLKAKKMDERKENFQESIQHADKKRRRGRPVSEILTEEHSKEDDGKSKVEESKKKPRWRDSAPPTIERPARARKAIERFGSVPEKESPRADKEVKVMKGSGMALKDIPNVVYKLGKISKSNSILVLLHTLLYGKRTKVNYMKSNILSFSGYVWGENKEEEQKKVKERLERLTRDGLYQLIDLLDIQISKSLSKKEELVEEGFQFLLAPKITRDTSVQEQEQQEQKSTEELSKGKERDKGKKGAGKSYQKKVLKDKDAPKRKREKRSKNAEDKVVEGEYPGEKKRIKSEKGFKEKQTPSKRSKKLLIADKQKKDQQSALEKMKEMDEAADDEELIEEEESTEGRTYTHSNENESDKGGDASEENVVTESPVVEKAEVEKVEEETPEDISVNKVEVKKVEEETPEDTSVDKVDVEKVEDTFVDKTEVEKVEGTYEDTPVDKAEVEKVEEGTREDAPVEELGEKDDDKAVADNDSNEKEETVIESPLVKSEDKEHSTDGTEDIKDEEQAFLASVQDYNKETEEPFLGFFGENSEENGGLLELPENEIELEGQDVSGLISEHVEAITEMSHNQVMIK
ncbi:hypothetical protein O6H91_Y463300 [Diphasiastrum complanatum]|nr:hypothetical protein O6H91_Y463300 [Diphasiastrum complanatum]